MANKLILTLTAGFLCLGSGMRGNKAGTLHGRAGERPVLETKAGRDAQHHHTLRLPEMYGRRTTT